MKRKQEKIIKREKLYGRIFIVLGLISLILAIFNIQRIVMLALTAGFLPVGILTLYSFKRLEKDEDLLKTLEANNDERNHYIRMKAGYTSHWASLWVLFILLMLNNIINISFLIGGLIIIFFMSISYFYFLWYYNNRY